MRKITVAIFFAVTLLASCSARKQLTPEEALAERERQIQMMSRVYEGMSPNEILMAADRVFRLADSDYTISHAETSLVATRNWVLYLVLTAAFGTDTWVVETFPAENATRVVTRHSGQAQSLAPTPTVGFNGQLGMTASTGPSIQGASTWSGPYRLFYERVDYLLGQRGDWVKCRDAKEGYEGPLDALCMCAEDLLPDGTSYKKVDPAPTNE